MSPTRSELPEFVSFPNGLTEEPQAVKAALPQRQVEGQGNRLKMVKPHVLPTMQQGATKRLEKLLYSEGTAQASDPTTTQTKTGS